MKKNLMKDKIISSILKISKFFTLGATISIISASSLIYLYNQRSLLLPVLNSKYRNDEPIDISKKDIEMAKKLMEGGFILHFRHAERDKWIDVTMYDSLESDLHINGENDSRYAEKDYFKDAVCLNERGLIQAKAIGEHLKNIGFPIGFVISSPSCRSRQTAAIAFDGYDQLSRELVHVGPYKEIKSERTKNLVNLYSNLPIIEGKNTIVSAHNGVIHYQMLENSKDPKLSLEEGGFYVISKKNNKLYLEHEFHNFAQFIRIFYKR